MSKKDDEAAKSLMERLMSKPVSPAVAPPANALRTGKVSISDNQVELELDTPAEEERSVTEDRARGVLEHYGLNPDEFEVGGMSIFTKESEIYVNENGDTETRSGAVTAWFKFRRKKEGAATVDTADLFEIARDAASCMYSRGVEVNDPSSTTFVVALGDMQLGKALKDDTPVLTDAGWKTHGDLKVGDHVYAPTGRLVPVLATTGSTEQDLYEVEFGDGTVIVASSDHLWSGTRKMHPAGYRDDDKPTWEQRQMVLSTAQIAELCDTPSGKMRPFVVDASEPVEMPEADLPIEPHLLGLWLGDGHHNSGLIAKGHQDADLLLRYGHQVTPNGHAFTVRVDGLTTKLREANLLGNKHIPEEYLYASVQQRLALLQGLMDTDGSCSQLGACEFSNTNEQIVEGVRFLLHSLGIRFKESTAIGKLNGVEKRRYWRLQFRSDLPMFTLERKAVRQRESRERKGIYRSIRAVRPAGSGSAQCITVEGGLYLAGRELVVTHNCDGDGTSGSLSRAINFIDMALERKQELECMYGYIDNVVISWLGDHVEGFVSQGGNNAWRTELTLTDQIRLTRRLMMYAMTEFAPHCSRLDMVAVPGNHGEAVRFNNKGTTRYDDSHDTESLIAVMDAARMAGDAFKHVSFYVPDTDEMTVTLDLADGTVLGHVHGHQYRPGKQFEWWQGQAFNGSSLAAAQVLLAGHLHHDHIERVGQRLYIGVPSTESESTWYRHSTGTTGCPGIFTGLARNGQMRDMDFLR